MILSFKNVPILIHLTQRHKFSPGKSGTWYGWGWAPLNYSMSGLDTACSHQDLSNKTGVLGHKIT